MSSPDSAGHCWFGWSGLIFCSLPKQPACQPASPLCTNADSKITHLCPQRKTSGRHSHERVECPEGGTTLGHPHKRLGASECGSRHQDGGAPGPVWAGHIMSSNSRRGDGCPAVGLCFWFSAWSPQLSMHLPRKEGTTGPCHKQKEVEPTEPGPWTDFVLTAVTSPLAACAVQVQSSDPM